MKDYSSINLNYLIRYKGITKTAFGELFEVGRQTLNNWVNGRNSMPVVKAFEIVDHFNITLDQFYRTELTEAVLKSGDPYYINNNPVRKASDEDPEYRKKIELGAVNGLEEMLRNIVRQEMKKNEPDKPSKAS